MRDRRGYGGDGGELRGDGTFRRGRDGRLDPLDALPAAGAQEQRGCEGDRGSNLRTQGNAHMRQHGGVRPGGHRGNAEPLSDPRPAQVRAYLQGRWQGVGHNPLGALSVLALLLLIAAQAGTGLFANDDWQYVARPVIPTTNTGTAISIK